MTGGAILLAAGFSRRFGADKRRHVLADGNPLLFSTLARYVAVFANDITVVLRPEDDELAAAARERHPGIDVVHCADAHLGMGHSLACGVRAVSAWNYAFVALADMAWVREATLTRLRAVMASAPAAIVQPTHRATPGHPVGFAACFFPELAALRGDTGARAVLQAHGEQVHRVAVDDPGVLADLDLPP